MKKENTQNEQKVKLNNGGKQSLGKLTHSVCFTVFCYSYWGDQAKLLQRSLEHDHNPMSLEHKHCRTVVFIVYLGSTFWSNTEDDELQGASLRSKWSINNASYLNLRAHLPRSCWQYSQSNFNLGNTTIPYGGGSRAVLLKYGSPSHHLEYLLRIQIT